MTRTHALLLAAFLWACQGAPDLPTPGEGERLPPPPPPAPAEPEPSGPGDEAAAPDAGLPPAELRVVPKLEARLQRERDLESVDEAERAAFFGPVEEGVYRVQPLDLLRIEVFDAEGRRLDMADVAKEIRVFFDGSIELGFLGAFEAAGKSRPELTQAIRDRLAAFVKDPSVVVTVAEYTKKYVTVVGPFARSGRLEFDRLPSLLELLGIVGWARDNPDQRKILVTRGQASVLVDLWELVGEKDFSRNLRLENGDVVMALVRLPITLVGQVATPGRFQVKGEARLPLREAIYRAGGLADDANLDRVRVVRQDGQEFVFNLNTYLFSEDPGPEIYLYQGDTLLVSALSPPQPEEERVEVPKQIFVLGSVQRPGAHRFTGSIRALQVLSLAQPRDPDAVIDSVVLVRDYPNDPKVYRLDLESALAGNLSQNVELADGDVVFVPKSGFFDFFDHIDRVMSPTLFGATAGRHVTEAAHSRPEDNNR